MANLLLVAAIDMAGLAVAFPVSIGIALVVGVISSYALQPKGNAVLLGAGVICAVIAVVLDGKAYGSLASAGQESGIEEKHCHLHRFRSPDGLVGAIRRPCDDDGKYAWTLQHCRVPHPGRVALLFHLERLLHEEAAGRRAR